VCFTLATDVPPFRPGDADRGRGKEVAVSTTPLPDDPDLDQLRRQAKELRRAEGIPLAQAQLRIARRHGFVSWPRLKAHLDLVRAHRWVPETVAAGADPAAVFLTLACLTYTRDDGPRRWAGARELLAAHPELPGTSANVAAATANSALLRHFLAVDPSLARAPGGPYGWPPLAYLAYARHDRDVPEREVTESARLLLAAGADADFGALWHGLPTPFTLLTGVFGGGELGPVRQPHHPHAQALARVLLTAGAEPNDGQALYNRMFEPGNEHLVLLFEFGLGRGEGGVWHARLGDRLDSPARMVRGQLRWAVSHGLADRVALLVEHGVDIQAPFGDGRTPAQLAALRGNANVVACLAEHGATVELDPVDEFVAAALLADPAVRSAAPRIPAAARRRSPALVVRAAALGRADSVALLVELGFDVNAAGRQDAAGDQEWETPLHVAVAEGNGELVRLLLSLGADPDRADARFHATPLGWARHFDRPDLVELLEPLTRPEPDAP
jgi:hypothetical protein